MTDRIPLRAIVTGGVATGLAEMQTGDTVPVANGGTGDTGSAWTSWVSTVSPTSGAFSNMNSAQFYKRLGKTVWFHLRINVIANGTGSGGVKFTLPSGVTPARDFVGSGRADGASGKALQALVSSSSSTGVITNYDGSYPASNGEVLVVNGFLETT